MDLELLRRLTAIAHVVPGAELRLLTNDGRETVVAHHPAADLDPCALRRAVLGGIGPGRPDPSSWIRSAEVGGALTAIGGGLFHASFGPFDQWWTATLLAPGPTQELLDRLDHPELPADTASATLKPDGCLGVTVVGIVAERVGYGARLGDLALELRGALATEELLVEVNGLPTRRPGSR